MLSPNPLSLLCALLLCFPLAIIFTVTTTAPNAATTNVDSFTVPFPSATPKPDHNSLMPPPLAPRLSNLKNKTNNASTTRSEARNSPKGFPGIDLFSPQRPNETVFTAPRPPDTENDTAISASSAAPPPQPATYEDPEDDAFFRVASRARAKAKEPRKVAFMFLTTGPLPFAGLWDMFFNNTPKYLYNIYIHADPTGNYQSPFQGVFANRVIPSKQALRATPTLVSAARRLLAHALLDDPSNYMFALLSPSCVPLRSFNFTREVLIRSAKSFIEILDSEPGAFGRWAARGEDAMLPEVRFEDFRIGSQFWALKRVHARLVVRDVEMWPKFALPCVRWDTCYPEENYFPTLLSLLDRRGCVPATLTHVDWRGRSDGHPRTYSDHEVGPELIEHLRNDRPRYGDEERRDNETEPPPWNGRNDPFLFARKFEPKALKPLMAIANEVIFKD